MKSSTPRPEEKRAERAVGSTWLEPADIVADRLRRVAAEEDRAGVADAADQAVGIGRADLKMLGRDRVDQRDRLVEVAHQDDGAEVAPGRRRDRGARQRRELALDRLLDRRRRARRRR